VCDFWIGGVDGRMDGWMTGAEKYRNGMWQPKLTAAIILYNI